MSIANELIDECNASVSVVNLRFIKPLDKDTLTISKALIAVLKMAHKLGVNYLLNEYRTLEKQQNQWLSFAIPDRFIDHGPVNDLFKEINLHPNQIKAKLKEKINVTQPSA